MFNRIPKRPQGSPFLGKTVYDNGGYLLPFQTILADTRGGAFSLNLPLAPNIGDWLTVIDAGNAFGTYPLTLLRGNSLIMGVADNLVCDNSGMVMDIYYSGPVRGWMFISNLTAYAPALVDLTGASADYALAIGQTAKISYSGATSVLLRIATVPGIYEMYIISDSSIAGGAGGITLLPNNASYAATSDYDFSYIDTTKSAGATSGTVAYAGNNSSVPFNLGDGLAVRIKLEISTVTNSKSITGGGMVYYNTTTMRQHQLVNYWNDTTTPWTSLGTLGFGLSQSGVCMVRRLL